MPSSFFIKLAAIATLLSMLSTGSCATESIKIQTTGINSKNLRWTHGEPSELVGTHPYEQWTKEFTVVDSKLAKLLDYTDHGVRYAYFDLTGDGVNEILVQDETRAARGLAVGVFQKQRGKWMPILQFRGAFWFRRIENKGPYSATVIEKFGADYLRQDLILTNKGYESKKKPEDYRGKISFDEFWKLNE